MTIGDLTMRLQLWNKLYYAVASLTVFIMNLIDSASTTKIETVAEV